MNSNALIDPWKIGISGWDAQQVRAYESILSIGNGRFGQRANFEEGYSGQTLRGSYLAGIYYPDKTRVGWWKNGYPEYFAKVLNATNWIGIDVKVGSEVLDLNTVKAIQNFHWEMNMKEGVLSRTFEVELHNGIQVRVVSERFCSMHRQEIGAIRYTVSAIGMPISVAPYLDADVKNDDSNWDDAFWRIHQVHSDENGTAYAAASTEKTNFLTCTGMACHAYVSEENTERAFVQGHSFENQNKAGHQYDVTLAPGQTVVVEKFVSIASSLHQKEDGISEHALGLANSARDLGFDTLKNEHADTWSQIWKNGDIIIDGDVSSQQAIRFNIFHLNQTYRGDDSRLNIGPKGFTGEKYGGASYWDTEAYCLPFFLAGHDEKVARQLLLYRYNHLEKAIENAGKLGFKDGAALYPMVTMNGEECHNEWEITFEEIHRNGAMVYAIWNYVNYTGDSDYVRTHGFDVILAVARFWVQRLQWSDDKDAYVMLGVTGPNEYENNVNNNWYTNYLSAWCLNYAADSAQWLQNEHEEDWHRLSQKWNISDLEMERWKEVASAVFLPHLNDTRVFLQQDGFMDKQQLSVQDLNPAERPINQHWSWDRILRSIFIKQADVLQGLYFFWDHFDIETHLDNYEFYEPKTVHESSLSPCVHAIIAVRLGKMNDAYEHYLRTSRLDLDDYNKEVYQGLHITSMAGTWLSVVEGFGGYRVIEGVPDFQGELPEAWNSLSFKLLFRKRLLQVRMTSDGTDVRLLSGEKLNIRIKGELQELELA